MVLLNGVAPLSLGLRQSLNRGGLLLSSFTVVFWLGDCRIKTVRLEYESTESCHHIDHVMWTMVNAKQVYKLFPKKR